MTKRTFKASELVAMGLPDDPQETMSIVSDVLCGHKRWSVVHELTFRLPGQPEGEAWRVLDLLNAPRAGTRSTGR